MWINIISLSNEELKMKASDELLFKYLLRLKEKDTLSRTKLNYSFSKTYPETERTRTLRNALVKKLINEKIVLNSNKPGRSATLYSISEKGLEFLTKHEIEEMKKEKKNE